MGRTPLVRPLALLGAIADLCVVLFFFFQAEDGIRDLIVTGVQTCALPIYPLGLGALPCARWPEEHNRSDVPQYLLRHRTGPNPLPFENYRHYRSFQR